VSGNDRSHPAREALGLIAGKRRPVGMKVPLPREHCSTRSQKTCQQHRVQPREWSEGLRGPRRRKGSGESALPRRPPSAASSRGEPDHDEARCQSGGARAGRNETATLSPSMSTRIVRAVRRLGRLAWTTPSNRCASRTKTIKRPLRRGHTAELDRALDPDRRRR